MGGFLTDCRQWDVAVQGVRIALREGNKQAQPSVTQCLTEAGSWHIHLAKLAGSKGASDLGKAPQAVASL